MALQVPVTHGSDLVEQVECDIAFIERLVTEGHMARDQATVHSALLTMLMRRTMSEIQVNRLLARLSSLDAAHP